MKYIISILLLFVFLIECNDKPQPVVNPYSEEDKIISVVFDTVIGQDSIWRKHRLLPPRIPLWAFRPGVKDRITDSVEYARYVDSASKRLDTAKLYVFVNDSLDMLTAFEKSILAPALKPDGYFRSPNHISDSDYKSLFVKLLDSIKPRQYKISEITSKYNYRITYAEKHKSYFKLDSIQSKVIRVATLFFSRAVINKDTTKAVLSISILPQGNALFFLCKTRGAWKVYRRIWIGAY